MRRRLPKTRPRQAQLVDFGSRQILVPVREIAFAKTMRLKVGSPRSGEVELLVPARTSASDVKAFLADSRGWIEHTIRVQLTDSGRLGLADPGQVPLLGRSFPLVRARGPASRTGTYSCEGSEVVAVFGAESEQPGALERLLREEVRRAAWTSIERETPKLGVKAKAVRIAGQRSRWGSASPSGTISLNWRLALAPIEVFDYVVIHEICHLLEMNHSPAFWANVASLRPGYQSAREWLTQNGREVRDWRAEDVLAY